MTGLHRSLAVALATALVAAALVAAVYGLADATATGAILAILGAGTVTAAHAVLGRREHLGGLRRQFGVVGLIVIAQLGLAVGVFCLLMFVSAHDALVTSVVVAYAAAVGLWAARVIGQGAMADVESIRETLAAVGEGRRDVRTGVAGSDELASLGRDVDAMVAMLDSEERARATLIAAVSHDLRTPITALRLLADAIDDGVVDAETRRVYAARMSTHVRALSALIDDLFELTRLQSGDLTWTLQQVDLDELVLEAVEAMRPAAEAGAVSVHAELGTRGSARANPEQLQRVLFNLMQNAIHHTPADGSVTVRAHDVEQGIEIEVADTGGGIAAEDRERIFEPFFRGGADAARQGAGAGLGLAISRAIVEAHGGRIWVDEATRGTRVRLLIPA